MRSLPVAARPLVVLVASWALSTGCADAPSERLDEAWAAAAAGDVEAFARLFTAQSAPLVRGLAEVKGRTDGRLAWVEDVFSLLPRGDVAEVVERDDLALVTVETSNGRYTVRFLRERGQWQIDARGLDLLWKPMGTGS